MNQAGADAEKTGAKLALGGRFKCPRLGYLTRETCLANFQAGHSACTTGFVCGIGRLEAEKEGLAVGYSTKKGDCACGTKDVRLDKDGRCYKCQAAAREEARRRTRMTPAAPEPAEAARDSPRDAPSVQEACGDDQRVGPRVEEAGEKLQEAIEADEDHAPDASQGWPETGGTLVIDGMEFEAFTATRAKASPTPLLTVQSGKVFSFNTRAIETFGLARFAFVELFASADRKSVAFRFSEDSPASGRGVRATDSKDRLRKRIGAQGFMSAFGLDLKGQGPWPLKQHQPGVLVARVG